jgi:hypothetical protein
MGVLENKTGGNLNSLKIVNVVEFVAYMCAYLTFMGPCIVIYFYSKTNKMHNFQAY